MKKFTLLLAAMFCAAGMANAAEELTLTRGWNCTIGTTEIGDIPQYPAEVTISGQWQNIKICTESFNATEWVSYKVVLAEPVEEGQIQVMVRNAAEAQAYGGTYQEIPAGVTEYTNTLSDIAFTGDDPVVTVFGIQNRTTSEVKFVLNDVVLYKADGTEWHTKLAADWGGTVKKLSPGEVIENYSFSQWGTLGHNFDQAITPADGDVHRFIVQSSEPFPAGFQWKIIRGSNDGDAIYPSLFTEGATEAVVELSEENIRKNADDAINYFTGVAIQARSALTLPIDVKMFYEVQYGNGAILREQLPIKVGSNGQAVIIDPNPSMEQGENGLPIGVEISGSYGAVGLWNEAFEIGEYIGYKVELAEKPADGTVQIFFRNETHGNSGAVYLPWETNEENGTVLSEDGTTLTGEFNMDAFEGDNTILVFAIQRIAETGTVRCIVKDVCLMNEDEEWVHTPGIGYAASSLWNEGSTFKVGGSYDENGNIWDAYVQYNAANDYLGTYSCTVEEGTYHAFTFYTEEPLPQGFAAMTMNIGLDWNTWQWTFDNVENITEGQGTNALTVKVPRTCNSVYISYVGAEESLPVTVRFTKITHEVFEGTLDIPTGITEVNTAVAPAAGAVYDMQGRRVAQPQKGLYIVNGRKVLMK